MELVKGIPITEYCDVNSLSIRERLELFVPVCHALQHAHQKGVIHRDIKPSNVLVTLHDGKPFPKVIDFGVAKAIAGRLTERTLFTEFRQMIGTPAYMSPEQAEMSGLDIDTRSDVYSARRAPLRAVDRGPSVRDGEAPESFPRRHPAHHPRGGATEALDQTEHPRTGATHRGGEES